MRNRLTSLAVLAGAIALAAGCEGGGASSRCDAIYSKVEQMPEFQQAGLAKYGNELRAAFGQSCGKLQEADLKCLEAAKASQELEACGAGRDAFKSAVEKVMEGK
jgi:hypothetical protein